jgi:hypothetical protein
METPPVILPELPNSCDCQVYELGRKIDAYSFSRHAIDFQTGQFESS